MDGRLAAVVAAVGWSTSAHDPADQQAGEYREADYGQRALAHLVAHRGHPLVLHRRQVIEPGADGLGGALGGGTYLVNGRACTLGNTIDSLVRAAGKTIDGALHALGGFYGVIHCQSPLDLKLALDGPALPRRDL
jgi:hypothetical protein